MAGYKEIQANYEISLALIILIVVLMHNHS